MAAAGVLLFGYWLAFALTPLPQAGFDYASVGVKPDFPHLQVATVDATVYHDAGASDATELAVATAVGVAYLRALTDAGILRKPVDHGFDRVWLLLVLARWLELHR